MNILAVLAALLLLPVALDLATKGRFRRLAVRNISRRKGEAVLVVAGSLLGTAIITASFVVGDTLDSSIRDIARTHLGPTDEVVSVEGLERFDEVADAVLSTPIEGADGTLRLISSGAAVATTDADRRAEAAYSLTEIDFDAARAFGGDEESTGLAGAGLTPSGTEAVVNERLAEDLGLTEGDQLEVFAYATSRVFDVRDIVPELGLAGGTVLVSPGTIASMVGAADAGAAQPPRGSVLVSNTGGVFDGVDGTSGVMDQLEARVTGMDDVEVEPVKQDLLDDAESSGESIGALFSAIGGFSVIAGILLLVNLFVMLAEERKTELGMMRALGMKRNQLMRAFAAEGALYAVLAAVIGAALGIAVGWVMVLFTGQIFAAEDDFELRFAVEPVSLGVGALTGLVIALVTIWLTSARISGLNVIRAIRDLPEPKASRTRLRTYVFSALGIVTGGLLFAVGLGGSDFAALLGLPIALFSAIPLVSRLLPRRVTVVGLSLAALVWGVAAFGLLPEVFEASDITVFIFQGVVLVAAAIAITSQIDHFWVGLAERLSMAGKGLATRLGLAYPLDRKFRTGMLLGMYAIVIFTITFMAIFNHMFARQGPTLTSDLRGGFDLYVDSNPANPISAEELESQPGVAAAATLLQASPDFTAAFEPDPTPWALTGFDEELVDQGSPALLSRDARFATDEEAYRAVLGDPSLALVGESFLQDDGPTSDVLDVGDEITVINPVSSEQHTLTVAGLTDDWLFNGVMVGDEFASGFLGDEAVPRRHYVAVEPGVDAQRVADELTGRLVPNGAEATTFAETVDAELAETQGFIRLLQGYLGLGLLIGIAGLGVVMVRAVRDRRRQVGMLRAMGFPAAVVRRAFLLEAGFIAVQGVVIGIGLGMLTVWNVVTNSTVFGEMELPFSVPWGQMAFILAVPLVFSLFATVQPAARAARIRPAVALRIAD